MNPEPTTQLPALPAVVLKRLVRLARSWLIRHQKRKSKVWLVRLRMAFDNLWLRFNRMPRTEWTLRWAERNHERIRNVEPPWRRGWKPNTQAHARREEPRT